jgi:hypothetical protein
MPELAMEAYPAIFDPELNRLKLEFLVGFSLYGLKRIDCRNHFWRLVIWRRS